MTQRIRDGDDCANDKEFLFRYSETETKLEDHRRWIVVTWIFTDIVTHSPLANGITRRAVLQQSGVVRRAAT